MKQEFWTSKCLIDLLCSNTDKSLYLSVSSWDHFCNVIDSNHNKSSEICNILTLHNKMTKPQPQILPDHPLYSMCNDDISPWSLRGGSQVTKLVLTGNLGISISMACYVISRETEELVSQSTHES